MAVAGAHGVRRLQRVASLHAATTVPAGADLDVEAAHDGLPDDLFLILRLLAIELHFAPAIRAALRKGNANLLVHPRRNRSTGMPAVPRPRFAPRPLRAGLRFSARKRCCLPLSGPERCIQLLAQALDLPLQAVVLLVQPLDLFLRLIQLSFGNKVDGLRGFLGSRLTASYAPSPYSTRKRAFCPALFPSPVFIEVQRGKQIRRIYVATTSALVPSAGST